MVPSSEQSGRNQGGSVRRASLGLLLVAVCISLAFAAAAECPIPGKTLRGLVVAITDGDTFTLLDARKEQVKIRLVGIDAPERSQAFGRVSSANLASIIFRKEIVASVTKIDRYRRCVSKVLIGESDVSLEQLRSGLAWVYTEYLHELSATDRSLYTTAARTARTNHLGLWTDSGPVPPWQFRRPRGTAASAKAETMGQTLVATDAGIAGVIGNKRSGIYHLPGCPGWSRVAPQNRERFATEAAAIDAGYRKAKNCP